VNENRHEELNASIVWSSDEEHDSSSIQLSSSSEESPISLGMMRKAQTVKLKPQGFNLNKTNSAEKSPMKKIHTEENEKSSPEILMPVQRNTSNL
jgi:hypothetical protein